MYPRKGIFEGQPVSFVIPNPTGFAMILGKDHRGGKAMDAR